MTRVEFVIHRWHYSLRHVEMTKIAHKRGRGTGDTSLHRPPVNRQSTVPTVPRRIPATIVAGRVSVELRGAAVERVPQSTPHALASGHLHRIMSDCATARE